MKWKILASLFIILAIFISLNFLIPTEEELPVSPVIYQYQADTYEMVEVKIGDIVTTEKITCRYNATSIEELKFNLDSCVIDEIYVSSGDSVQVGDVLASLYIDDLLEELEDCESSITKLNLELSQTEEKYNLAYQSQVNYRATLSAEELALAATPSEKVEIYTSQIEEIEDELWLVDLRIAELEEEIENKQIIATMDGVISYAKEISDGEISNKDITVVKILDSATSVFSAKTEYENILAVGDIVEITIDSEIYSAQVVSSDDYADAENASDDEFYYYFELIDPQITLVDGDSGKVEIIIEERRDVLYLPEDAFGLAKGEDVVFYLNDEGIREVIYVEKGLASDGYVEVVSGLVEGQVVILG